MAMICLLGFGEVGQTFGEDLRSGFTAWDVQFVDPASVPTKATARLGMVVSAGAREAVAQAGIVVCAVTAAQDKAAAESVSGLMKPGAVFMDVNSASPGQKTEAAVVIESVGGRYVEAVIMSAIGNKRLASPRAAWRAACRSISARGKGDRDFRRVILWAELGLASATKFCRSVIIKGMEALLTESMLAARHYGVERAVLESLIDFFPGQDWEKLSRYMISRAVQHGTRRAKEMREAARTVQDAGLERRHGRTAGLGGEIQGRLAAWGPLPVLGCNPRPGGEYIRITG